MKKLLLLLMIAFCSCQNCIDYEYAVRNVSHEIDAKVSKELKLKYGFSLRSFGGGAVCGIRELSLGFVAPGTQPMTITEARKMMVESVELYLKRINEDPQIRPVLIEYPFPPSRIVFSFGIEGESLESIQEPKTVTYCACHHGTIFYYTTVGEGSGNFSRKSVKFFEEPYSEAKEIVEETKIGDAT